MNSFGARSRLQVGDRAFEIHRLQALEAAGFDVARLPYSLRVLLENLLRREDGVTVTADDITALARWEPSVPSGREIAFQPARVLMQDFTGVPAIVDLAAMRDAMAALGGDPARINPLLPVELVVDHSMQVDVYGSPDALRVNRGLDYERNRERYALLRWGQQAFDNLRVVPPYMGIVHQVNLEHLARVVFSSDENPSAPTNGLPQAYPDTVVGTDSHTPMVNGLGVLGWGVGGIEAEAAMLGQRIAMLIPQVIGFRLEGDLREGVSATDLVLTVTEMLRARGVVGRFVEFYGPGIATVTVADRATIANMSPEYGATCAMFPVDAETLRYLRFTGRSERRVALVEAYTKEQGLFMSPGAPAPVFTETLVLDLGTVEPSLAGPRRPQDRVPLSRAGQAFREVLESLHPSPPSGGGGKSGLLEAPTLAGIWGEERDAELPAVDLVPRDHHADELEHGSVVIASITSCTNTSNPSVIVAAGLLARRAVERGLLPKPWVKTSLAPGSKVVTRYLERAGLTPYLDALGFHTVGYGCATCIGNSGPLAPSVSDAIEERGLVVCAALSGNRNFEGRIHSEVRANYLMSPPLVVAYALVGRMDWDPQNDPIGYDAAGDPVFLRDLWPSRGEVERTIAASIEADMFRHSYAEVFAGDELWQSMPIPGGRRFAWDPQSTYVRRPPYFDRMTMTPQAVAPIRAARALAVLGDSLTTDHISPAGTIRTASPAGRWLREHGVLPKDFNSYGARRGNHEVMVRGTFANGRIRNRLAHGVEGGVTTHLPSRDLLPIHDAALRYAREGVPLVILAGREYGSGSSRDWAAKGPALQGVRAVIAQSFERIHRSNLVGMGILPLQFRHGESVDSHGLTGREQFDVLAVEDALGGAFVAGRELVVRAVGEDGAAREFTVLLRIDTPQEALYCCHGGILPYVLRQLLAGRPAGELVPGAVQAIAQPAPDAAPPSDVVEESSAESFPASDPPAY